MNAPENNLTGRCKEGFQGVLCTDCEVEYSRTGIFDCDRCPNPVWNVVRIIVLLIILLVAVAIIIRSTLLGAFERKNYLSVFLRIFLNHI